MTRRWGTSVAMAVCGLLFGGAQLMTGAIGLGLLLIVVFAVLALVLSPRAFLAR